MKALTLQQPWAWAIGYAGKNVENRSRNLAGAYRGQLLIHAGLRLDEAGFYDEMIKAAFARYDDSWVLSEQVDQLGVVVGVVDLASVHHGSDHGQHQLDRCSPWAQHDQWHLTLANPRPLPRPIPCRGHLGLWTPPLDVVDQVREQLETTPA